MIPGGEKDLGLVHQPPEGLAVDDPVSVPLKFGAERALFQRKIPSRRLICLACEGEQPVPIASLCSRMVMTPPSCPLPAGTVDPSRPSARGPPPAGRPLSLSRKVPETSTLFTIRAGQKIPSEKSKGFRPFCEFLKVPPFPTIFAAVGEKAAGGRRREGQAASPSASGRLTAKRRRSAAGDRLTSSIRDAVEPLLHHIGMDGIAGQLGELLCERQGAGCFSSAGSWSPPRRNRRPG